MLFLNNESICKPTLANNNNNISAKKTDGQNLEDNSTIYEVQIKEANLNLIPPLSTDEYELLKESIKDKGLLVPIVVNQEGFILDGVHRYRACKELGIPIKSTTKQFMDSNQEKLFQIEVNLRRRQMNAFQRIEVGYSLESILMENARRRMSLGGTIVGLCNAKQSNSDESERVASAKATLESIEEKGKVSTIIAKKIGVSTSVYEKGKKIIKEANELQKNSLRYGSASINKEYSNIRKQEIVKAADKNQVERDVNAKLVITDKQDRIVLINGDFQNKQDSISDNSVDLIITDPTNYTQDLQIYRKLANFANRLLMPGGSLVTYAPNHSLPQVFKNMSVPNLNFWWQLAITEEYTLQSLKYQVYSAWNPLLWYVKNDRPKRLNSISDLIDNGEVIETLNGKQKELTRLEYIISKLSIKNDLVVDPFMGTGVIGRAALNLNRRFIGIEKDSQIFLSAKAELLKEYNVRKVEQV